MKSLLKNCTLTFLCCTICAVTACSDDDGKASANADVVGVYKLTSWNAPVALDLDASGTASSNLMNETPCYNNSVLSLNSDGTYTMTYNYLSVEGNIPCQGETTHGTWNRDGQIVTTSRLQGGETLTGSYMLSSAAQTTLTRTETAWNYPSISPSNQLYYAQGTVVMVMTRQ